MESKLCKIPNAAVRELHTRYLAGESPSDLEREVGYKKGSLLVAFKRLNLRSLGRTNYVPLEDKRAQHALALWDDGASAKAAGETVGLSQTIMTRLLRETGRNGVRTGPAHSHWKGGRWTTLKGYVCVNVPSDDPFAEMRVSGGWISEHRLMMARHLGRSLQPNETVHHINGIRDDNRIENLQLRVGNHGQGRCLRCTQCGSTDWEEVALS